MGLSVESADLRLRREPPRNEGDSFVHCQLDPRSVGGPILQNRIHYFGAFERTQQDTLQVVDTQGLLLGVLVHAASIQDADSAGGLLRRIKPLYNWLRAVFADSIYNRLAALLACFLFGLTLIVVRRAAGTTGFVVQPRRWVVERSLGWLGRWRRLSKDYEELPAVSEAMVTLAMIRLMVHRLAYPSRKRLPPP